MLTYFDLRKGVRFVLDGQPYEVLDFKQIGKAQDVVVARVKIKNLVTGKIIERNFHQDDTSRKLKLKK
jgi:elongation factor P